jgi:hypothetical protein
MSNANGLRGFESVAGNITSVNSVCDKMVAVYTDRGNSPAILRRVRTSIPDDLERNPSMYRLEDVSVRSIATEEPYRVVLRDEAEERDSDRGTR